MNVFDELLRIDAARTQGWITTSGDSSVRGPDDELLATIDTGMLVTITSYTRREANRDAICAALNSMAPLARVAQAAQAWLDAPGSDNAEVMLSEEELRALVRLTETVVWASAALQPLVEGLGLERVGHRRQPGLRDPEHPCTEFEPGAPKGSDCITDGHYLCAECVHAIPRIIAARNER